MSDSLIALQPAIDEPAVSESVLVYQRQIERHVLPLAARVGETEIDEFDVFLLDHLQDAFAIHLAEGTYAGGVHLELTGQDVTECTGGAQQISEASLGDRYRTHCDPRLNASQALDLSFMIADALRRQRAQAPAGRSGSPRTLPSEPEAALQGGLNPDIPSLS